VSAHDPAVRWAREEHRQRGYRVRLEWGPAGVELLAEDCAVLVVVDVLSFCTAVDIAVGRGAAVLPQRSGDPAGARAVAERAGAVPAGRRAGAGPSLRPSSLVGLAGGTRLALPSPNGGALCAAAARSGVALLAGCLRNAAAVAAAAAAAGGPVGLVAAGERWPDGSLRVAVEDAVGAGAVAAHLAGCSPEADMAAAQFAAARSRGLFEVLAATSSGRELVADGYRADVVLAAALDTSRAVPRLRDGVLAAGDPR
jgi:2-phosphosulfolactate phosphatase